MARKKKTDDTNGESHGQVTITPLEREVLAAVGPEGAITRDVTQGDHARAAVLGTSTKKGFVTHDPDNKKRTVLTDAGKELIAA